MSKLNAQGIPTEAVGTNMSYLDYLDNNLHQLWGKIRTNPFVNMVFPVEELSNGNTEAILPLLVPGGLAVKEAVTTAREIPATKLLIKGTKPTPKTQMLTSEESKDFWNMVLEQIPEGEDVPVFLNRNEATQRLYPTQGEYISGSEPSSYKLYKGLKYILNTNGSRQYYILK